MIIFGLSISRKESRKIYNFLNKEDGFNIGFESDLNKISWSDSQIIVMNRVKLLEKNLNAEAVSKFGSDASGKNLPFSSLSEKLDNKKKEDK